MDDNTSAALDHARIALEAICDLLESPEVQSAIKETKLEQRIEGTIEIVRQNLKSIITFSH